MTKYQKKTYTPTWEPIALTEHICGGYEAPLVLRVFDYDADGTHVGIHFVEFHGKFGILMGG